MERIQHQGDRNEEPREARLLLTPAQWFALLLAVAVVVVPASPGIALFLGAAVVNLVPRADYSALSGQSKRLLALAVVGLGAGVQLETVIETGTRGVILTASTLMLAGGLAWVARRLVPLRENCGLLIATGTAICGGSAIAAAAPALRADEEDTGVALATVFILNGVALYAFPLIAALSGMDARIFGEWAALAIHDMSSVVGAAVAYSPEALETAVPMKLMRALWIVPLTYLLSVGFRTRAGTDADEDIAPAPRASVPWFLVGFLVAAVLFNTVEAVQPLSEPIVLISRRLLTLAIYLLGLTLSLTLMRRAGPKPVLFALVIWLPLAFLSWVLVTWL